MKSFWFLQNEFVRSYLLLHYFILVIIYDFVIFEKICNFFIELYSKSFIRIEIFNSAAICSYHHIVYSQIYLYIFLFRFLSFYTIFFEILNIDGLKR